MARVYCRLVKAGKISIDDVPERWREEVRRLLEE